MMLNKASAHLYTLDNNMYTRKTFTCSKSRIEIQKTPEICLKLIKETPERLSTVSIVKFGHMPHLFLAFLLTTLNKYRFTGSHFINL